MLYTIGYTHTTAHDNLVDVVEDRVIEEDKPVMPTLSKDVKQRQILKKEQPLPSLKVAVDKKESLFVRFSNRLFDVFDKIVERLSVKKVAKKWKCIKTYKP